jgi:hypothetical protein
VLSAFLDRRSPRLSLRADEIRAKLNRRVYHNSLSR